MQSDCDLMGSEVFTAEVIQALDVVFNLAEGNCLDTTDPLVASDADLLHQAQCQSRALETVQAFLNKLTDKPNRQA